MTTAAKRNRESLPVGDLGIIALKSSEELGQKVNDYIVGWRSERDHRHKALPQLEGYTRDNYLIRTETPRFGSGEGKGTIFDSIRGEDIYLLIDVCNYSITYTMRVKVIKNKVAPPFKKAEFDLMFNEGISRVGEIIDLGVEKEILTKSGSWYSYEGNKLAQGRDAAKNVLRDNPDLAEEIENKIMEALKK